MAGGDYSFTFDDAGNYDYFCMVHPWMVGSVTVSNNATVNDSPTTYNEPKTGKEDGSVVDFEKLLKEKKIRDEEKKRAEIVEKEMEEYYKAIEKEEVRLAAIENSKIIKAELHCKDVEYLAKRILTIYGDVQDWEKVEGLKISSEYYSPILNIQTDRSDVNYNLLYTNGDFEQHIKKDNWIEFPLFKSIDNKIKYVEITKAGATDYQELISCNLEIIEQRDIVNKIAEIKEQRESEKENRIEQARQEQIEAKKQQEQIYNRSGIAVLEIQSNTYWNAMIMDGNQATSSFDGYGNYRFDIPCGKIDIISLNLQKQTADGFIEIQLIQKDKILNQASTTAQYGIASIAAECIPEFGGGCLIATATYGSEMAKEVQQLRELRDNTLLNTESGTQFMGMFNDIYYSFSPVIADYERENTLFKEAVKIAITPMISSLSILNYVDMDSESEVLGYGISLILLNFGMYLGVPAVVIIGIRKIK
jgi:hypothetical protein